MPMPAGTFKNKLSEKYAAYKFTETEKNRLKEILIDIAADIQDVAGMSFQEALSKVVKKDSKS